MRCHAAQKKRGGGRSGCHPYAGATAAELRLVGTKKRRRQKYRVSSAQVSVLAMGLEGREGREISLRHLHKDGVKGGRVGRLVGLLSSHGPCARLQEPELQPCQQRQQRRKRRLPPRDRLLCCRRRRLAARAVCGCQVCGLPAGRKIPHGVHRHGQVGDLRE